MSVNLTSNTELPRIVDDRENNNYAKWRMQSQCKLHSWGLWKYIDRSDSTPPNIHSVREKQTGCN